MTQLPHDYVPVPDIAELPPHYSTIPESASITTLNHPHLGILEQAIVRLLSLPVAEATYAQILDGLPTYESLRQFQHYLPDSEHPVVKLGHNDICQEALDKLQEYRASFCPSSLTFPVPVLRAFQASEVDTKTFRLRLIELVAVACHQIAVIIYQQDAGPHKHADYENWRPENPQPHEPTSAPSPFTHNYYIAVSQYPNGVADCAGYWAEAKIFGGVVIFDRGESEMLVRNLVDGCRDVYLHGSLADGAKTIYPPTKEQLDQLFAFFLGPDDMQALEVCPLPIHVSWLNRYRWDQWEAFAWYHIFRDRHERKIAPQRYPSHRFRTSTRDFPECQDQLMESYCLFQESQGEVTDPAEKRARYERMLQITPSSPLWHGEKIWNGIDESERDAEIIMQSWTG